MKKIIIIGGSKGIGQAIIQAHIDTHEVINISRTPPAISHPNVFIMIVIF